MVRKSTWPHHPQNKRGGCWTSSENSTGGQSDYNRENKAINKTRGPLSFISSTVLQKTSWPLMFFFPCPLLPPVVSYGHCMVSQIQQAQTICLNWSRYTASAACSSSQAGWGLRRSVQYSARPSADRSKNRQVSRARCKRLWGVS